ncbi:hypothetical protein [Ferrovibrio sp.]|uniref:hypothetical protein n=1 Tax=Ferrovibrio sp. TaxID=1917215 RepID=UPI003D10065B
MIELLAALAVVAVLSLLLAQAMRGGTQFWLQASHRVEAAEEADATLRFLRGRLAQAYPAADAALAQIGIGFEGREASLDWLSDLPAGWHDAGGYQRARLRLVDSPEGRNIEFSWSPWQGEARGWQSLSLGAVRELRFAYWSSSSGWRPEWLEQRWLPELIRLEIIRADGHRDSLHVAPRITARVGCRLQPMSSRCEEF